MSLHRLNAWHNHVVGELFAELVLKRISEPQEWALRYRGFHRVNLEQKADQKKNDIRNHLPRSLFLPIDRSKLLDILTLQDCLADRAEDIAVMTTLKRIEMIEPIKANFNDFLAKNPMRP